MKNTFILFLLFLLASCSPSSKDAGEDILHVTLEETPVSIKDLFSKIEIIPLETNDSSLLAQIRRVREYGGNYYLLSEDYPTSKHISLMVFDSQGRYVRSIGKVGQGPEEYPWLIYDAAIDADKELVYMMSPSGMVYVYRLDGRFVRKMMLPEKMAYHRMEVLKGGELLGWSAVNIDENALTVADADSATLIREYWKDHFCLNWEAVFASSYQYKGKTYFTPAVYNQVYEVTPDSLKPAYQWDFGKDNIDMKKYRQSLSSNDRAANNDEWRHKRRDGSVPYAIRKQGQSKRFYYARLLYSVEPKKAFSLFYEKATGKTFFFIETTEGITLQPEMITDEYMLMLVSTENLEELFPALSEEEKAKATKRLDDDNPCLVRFIF